MMAISSVPTRESFGFDAEYANELKLANGKVKNVPTYIQVALPDTCYVFNLRTLSRDLEAIKQLMNTLFARGKMIVGLNVRNDAQQVFDYFKMILKIPYNTVF